MKNTSSRAQFATKTSIVVFLCATFGIATLSQAAAPSVLPPQQQQVTGTVTDQNGLSIPGVAVYIKGSSTGTLTNPDGAFTINAAPDAILVFTYLGFQTMEVPIDYRNEINIRLEEDVTALGEVEINAGYYHTTRRESTGNISRVTAEEIELQPVVSPIQALQGRMAGVEIIQGPSHPGAAPTIRIRGTNSLREEGNYPLYIIDGVPVNSAPIESGSLLAISGIDPLNTMNLSNIESIEVLKDADATAIYGSRGANGVILITTKKAREGKMQLQANLYSGSSTVPNRVDLLNTQQYLEIRRRAFQNDGTEPTRTNAYDLVLWDQNRYTDWQDVFFGGTSPITNLNLSLSGGNEFNSFRLTGSFQDQGSVYPGEFSYKKVTTSLQANHSSKNQKLKMNLSLNFGLDRNNQIGWIPIDTQAFNLPPNAPKLFNDDGSLHWEAWDEAGSNHPLEGFNNQSLTKGQNLNANLLLDYNLIKGLSIRTNIGYTTYTGNENIKIPRSSYNPKSWTNREHRSTHRISESASWIIEPQLVYNVGIGKSGIEALIGGALQQRESTHLNLAGEGYVSESIIGNLLAADDVQTIANDLTDYRYSAIFARVGYKWNKKYFINLTGRRDGSSRFGPGKRFANFGALGAAWLFSEEKFVRDNLSFISFGKFRGSYGTTGNDQIGDYGFFDAYKVTPGPGGLYPSQLANPDYSWEVNKKLELALELGFLKDRINLDFSWFNNRSSNQLVGYALPGITGFTSVQANLPATVENTGYEIEVATYNIDSKNFKWQSSLNFTLPKNRLVEYPDLENSPYADTYRIGQPLNIAFLYQYSGLDPETGLYSVVDANQDRRLDWDDRTQVWNHAQEYFGGIYNNLTYKNFSLQFLWQFVKQEGALTMFDAGFRGGQRNEVYEALEPGSRFQKISTSTAAQRAYADVLQSDFILVDASFLRLKTLSLAYTIPNSVLDSIGLQSGKIYFNGQNLLTLTNYEGLDPENANSGGVTFSGLRTITAGIQFTL